MKKAKKIFSEYTWLFIFGCILGYIIEVLSYYIKHQIWLNKKGLIYGPFKPVYGIGIVLLAIFAKKKKNTNIAYLFVIGILYGSAYEYITSLFQEYVLGTSTWNYSNFNLNLNGRIYLPYCIGWGLATVLFIKYLYPLFIKIIDKIPYYISVIAFILIMYDMILSTIVVVEYSNRNNNIYHKNFISKYINNKYDDKYMKENFPKVKIIKK